MFESTDSYPYQQWVNAAYPLLNDRRGVAISKDENDKAEEALKEALAWLRGHPAFFNANVEHLVRIARSLEQNAKAQDDEFHRRRARTKAADRKLGAAQRRYGAASQAALRRRDDTSDEKCKAALREVYRADAECSNAHGISKETSDLNNEREMLWSEVEWWREQPPTPFFPRPALFYAFLWLSLEQEQAGKAA